MKKIFFNHIPKTAGTTFYEYISRFYKESEIYPKSSLGGYEAITNFNEVISDDIKFIASHKNFREDLDDSWNIITFVRDPRERLLSLYNHWKSWTNEEIDSAPTDDDVKNLKKSFKDKSLVEILKLEDELINFHFINGLSKNLIPINKHHLINNENKLLKEAKKQLDKMSFIGVVERFEESQFLFEYLFNLPHEKNLEKLNERTYDFTFTKDEEDEIDRAIAVDIEIYDYALKKFQESLQKFILNGVNSKSHERRDQKVFFLHLMKAGGTSVIEILKKHFKQEDIVPPGFHLVINSRNSNLNDDLNKQLFDLRNDHIYKDKIKKMENLLPEKSKILDLDFKVIFNDFKFIADHTTFHTVLPEDWSVVTMLRDPKKRVLSQINDLKTVSFEDIEKIPETTVGKKDFMLKIKNMTADEILCSDNAWISEVLINNQTKFIAGFYGKNKEFRNQKTSDILKIAVNNLNKFLVVGISERFFESVALIHYKLKLPFKGCIPELNSRKYKPEEVDNKLLSEINKFDEIIYKIAKDIFYKQYFEMLEEFVDNNFYNKKIEKKECLLMEDDFVGTGWHQREGFDLNMVYRWSGPSNISTVRLPFFAYQIKKLKINVISAMHSDIVRKSKFYLNGKKVFFENEDLGKGHFVIKILNTNTVSDFAELKIETPYTISHADIGVDQNDKRKKGIAITKIDFELRDFRFHNKPVLLCPSLGTKCGISTYTELLSESNNIPAVANLSELYFEIPSHIHLQHEFGIAPYDLVESVIAFCKVNDIKFYSTLHTVLPISINVNSKIFSLFSFLFLNDYVIFILKKVIKILYKYKIIDKLKWLRWKLKEGLKFIWWKFEFSKAIPIDWDYHLGDRVHGVHDPWWPIYINENSRYFKNQNLVVSNSDKIFVHSESAKQTLLKQGAKKVELFIHPVLMYEVSKDLYSVKDGRIHFGFFGFFNKDKSIYEIIQSCKKVPNCVLHIYSCVQDHHDKDYLRKVENEVEKNEWIEFHKEFLPLGEVIFNLSKCDILLWNTKPISHYSSSGSIRQYLAAKRPIIARRNNLVEDLEGIINIINDISGEALVNELKNSYSDEKIKEYLTKYSWENSKIIYD